MLNLLFVQWFKLTSEAFGWEVKQSLIPHSQASPQTPNAPPQTSFSCGTTKLPVNQTETLKGGAFLFFLNSIPFAPFIKSIAKSRKFSALNYFHPNPFSITAFITSFSPLPTSCHIPLSFPVTQLTRFIILKYCSHLFSLWLKSMHWCPRIVLQSYL